MHLIFGSSLIEVIIALFILGISFVALEVSEFTIAHETPSLIHRQIAITQARFLSNQLKVIHGENDAVLANWNQLNSELLPRGKGGIFENKSKKIIVLAWGRCTVMNCFYKKDKCKQCLQVII